MSTSFLHKTVLIDSIIDKLFDTLSILMLITFQSALQHLWAVRQSSSQPWSRTAHAENYTLASSLLYSGTGHTGFTSTSQGAMENFLQLHTGG